MGRRNVKIGILVVWGLGCVTTTWGGAERKTQAYGQVELLRDTWGIPHVFAETDAGALYGAGWAGAEDRGFQMYYFLRIMQGRLAEVMGDQKRLGKGQPATTLESDIRMRAFGFARAAETVVPHLDAETLALLKAYCQGVNDYFAQDDVRVSPLFERLGLEREPWTPADCILSWWHMAQFFAKNGLNDVPSLTPRQDSRGRMPHIPPDDEAAVVRREDVSDAWVERVNAFLEKHGLTPKPANGPDTPDPKFSHAWVIGGGKTTTGSAVLVSDPQTPVWNPNMFYEFHLCGKTFNVRGMGMPGCPMILIGFNTKVAWGLTALGADQADLFLLKTDSGHPHQYQVDGEWLDMEQHEETIKVKGGEDVTLKLESTLFGPVVTRWVARKPQDKELALSRVPMVETDRDTIQAMLPMFRAQTSQEFAKALPLWRFPTANCIFGDVAGQIGYWSLGALPIRSPLSKHGGGVAQDGSTRVGAWQGMIPYDLLPHVFDPQRGYLVTANHRTIQSFYKVPFGTMTGASGDTDRGLRIKERITAFLAEQDKFTPEDVLAIQDDCVNVWKREVVRLGMTMLTRRDVRLSKETANALRYLKPWYETGAAMDTRVRGTEVAEKMSVIFRGGQYAIVSRYGGGVSGLARFAKATRARFEADPETDVTDDEAEFADRVIKQAWLQCQRSYGNDTRAWLERAHQAMIQQSMAYLRSLDGFVGLDPNLDVPLPCLKTQDGSSILSQKAQAYTQYVPLHDVDASLSILPPGVSEDPQSPFRFSMYGDWARGVLHPAPLSRLAVEPLKVSQRNLTSPPPSSNRRQTPRKTVRRAQGTPETKRTILPGKRPEDPVLENAIRYMNRKERTPDEIRQQLVELREYVKGDAERKTELMGGLELFIYLMRESQAGNMPILYGTLDTLKQVEALYKELKEKG